MVNALLEYIIKHSEKIQVALDKDIDVLVRDRKFQSVWQKDERKQWYGMYGLVPFALMGDG